MTGPIDLVLIYAPLVILGTTCLWLLVATRRTSAAIGRNAYGFGGTPRQRLAQILFRLAVAGGLAAVACHAAGLSWFAVRPLDGETLGLQLVGVVVALAGQGLTIYAQGDMGRRWRVGVPDVAPDRLVTTGLFEFSRNPVFLGMLAMAAGLAVAVPSPLMIACALAFWVACELQVRDEETFLENAFGQDYRDYKHAVRRWI